MGECYSGTICMVCKMSPINFIGIEIINGVIYRKYECTGCGKHFRSRTSLTIGKTEKHPKQREIVKDLYEMAIDNQRKIYHE